MINDKLDFDAWRDLAETDPEAFETQRKAMLEAIIERVPHSRQQRLRCLQWRIESVCAVSKSPMSASLQISNMMWESLRRQQHLLSLLSQKDPQFSIAAVFPSRVDNVVPLRRPR